MMTANVGTSYEWKFDGEDEDEGFVADDASMSMDMDSFMSILEETMPEDCSQNGLADPSLSTAPYNESASDAGPNEYSPTLDEASAGRTVCSSGSSDFERQTVNHGVVGPPPDVSSAHLSSWTPGDWAAPLPPGVSSSHYDNREDFSSYSRHNDVNEPKNGTFGTGDGNVDLNLMDNSGMTDEMYSDVFYNVNEKSYMPYIMDINEPYSGTQAAMYNSGMLFDDKIALGNGPFLRSSESSTKMPAKVSANGTHYPSMLPNKQHFISIVDEKPDVGTEKSFDVADLLTDKNSLPPFYGINNSHHFRPSQSYVHQDVLIKKQHVSTKEEIDGRFSAFLPPELGMQAFRKNTTYIDVDDPDICILEDMSGPAARKPSSVGGKSPISVPVRPPLGVPPLPVGYNNARTKANDEHIVYRAALQDLSQPKSEAYAPEGSLEVQLLRHQRIALSWMVQKETKSLHCFGGILADDQGLGKTISTISLILKERSPSSSINTAEANKIKTETLNLDDDDDDGDDDATERYKSKQTLNSCVVESNTQSRPAAGTLVVCPTSVLRQWNDELHNKVSSKARLSVLVYHGPNRTKDPCELAKYDVVLTTYAIVSMEVPKQPLVDEDDDETKRRNEFNPVGNKRKHSTSSKSSKKGKKGIDSELYEVLAKPLAKVRWFRVVLDEAQSIKNYRTQVARACWGLKAKRRWCLSGTPIQNAIDDLYSYFRFLRYDPYTVYKTFCSTIKSPIQRNPANGYKKLQAVLKTIMLRRTKATLLDGQPIISLPPKTINLKKVDFTPEERDFYCRLESDSRAQFEEYAAAGTVKQNYVNILLMLLRLRQACDHPLLVKGCKPNSEWKSSLDKAKKLPTETRIRLLNCLEASLAICSICSDPPEDAVVTPCEHVFCNQCILEHLSTDDSQCPSPKCKVVLNTSSIFSKLTLKSSIDDEITDFTGVVKQEISDPCSSSWSHNIVASEALDSSKIKAAVEVLESIAKPREIETDDKNNVKVVREKAIVFSQWTRMLDLLEACLNKSSIGYRRLDGTMSIAARDKAVKDFNTLPEVNVMIMSLKAASLGLNMVAACHVLLLDLWWNPTTEDQAVDRAHRIGQTRPVSVLRLTVKDTVEDRILALQQKKREMVASAFGEDETGSSQTRLTVDDLKYLFQS
ncbi:helicase-like transcription factor CHR28 isoform X2 [Helianthus annuus]|uniref:helicase-like transcription factor CHR28 isoform X2 n=1 Tax=Helianthus annuus TaxID=4232 RepID=UPI000B8EFC5C|nr:helicase-like transcription factor CHR28 isoform X2 [Helianthus annuus]